MDDYLCPNDTGDISIVGAAEMDKIVQWCDSSNTLLSQLTLLWNNSKPQWSAMAGIGGD